MSRLLRGICQLKMPPASEITEPLAFTVRKVELRGKAIVLQTRFRRIRVRPVVNNKGQNGEKRCATKQKKLRGNCQSMITKRHSWQTWNLQIESIWYRISGLSSLPRKGCWGVQAFWGLWHLDRLINCYYKKSLFPNNSCTFLIFYFNLLENVTLNNEL